MYRKIYSHANSIRVMMMMMMNEGYRNLILTLYYSMEINK